MKLSSWAALAKASAVVFLFVALPACVSHAAGETKAETKADPRIALGRTKAMQCNVCHGANGIATAPMTPNIAGQQRDYLEEQLKNYRSGKRPHEVMAVMAKPLTDDDITNLSTWYAAMIVEVKLPEK
jgi:cytochrome c553